MTSKLDEMYDEMLRGEFRFRGKHAAPDTAQPPGSPTRLPARQVAAADAPIHDAFEVAAPPATAAAATSAESEGPRGLARYRNAAMVGAGGLACAAVGAFLGGLGGAFTISPAAAHPLASATAPDQSAVAAAEQAAGDAGSSGTAALTTAALSSLSGSLTEAVTPLQWLTSQTGSAPATLGDLSSAGTGSGPGTGIGCTPTTTDLGLGCVLGGLTTALGTVGTLPSDRTETLGSLAPTLTGVVSNFTGTLAELGSLIPIASLPLPAGGLPSLGLPGLSALDSVLPATAGTPSSLLTGTGGIAALLDSVAAAVSSASGGAGSGSTSPTLPALPLGGSGSSSVTSLLGLSGLPASASASGSATTPAASGSGSANTGSTTSTTSATTTTSTTTVTVPLPAVPVPVSTPPVTVGGVSAGVSTSGSDSGLTLSLP